MGGVRIKRNDLPKIIRRLPREMDKEVDRSGDSLAPLVRDVVRVAHGTVLSTVKNYEAGALHATVGVGIHEGRGFYIRFYEWGTSTENAFGNVIRGDQRIYLTSQFWFPEYVDRMATAVRRAVR